MAKIHQKRESKPTKASQLDGIQLLNSYAREGRTAFTSAEARETWGLSPSASSNRLSRLAADGLVDRIGAGRYAIRPIGSFGTAAAWDDLGSAAAAAFVGHHHRISFLTALDLHGLLVHPVRTVYVASAYRPRLASLSGRPLRVVFEREGTVLEGTEPLGPSRVASVARALLDTASRPQLSGGVTQLVIALAAARDARGLPELAMRVHALPAYRRIGSIAAALSLQIGNDLTAPDWRSLIVLDPAADHHRGWIDKTWGIAWPFPASELESVARE